MKEKLGILVLPPFDKKSIPYIKKYTQNTIPISNYVLGVPHKLIKFADEPNKKIFGDNTIRVSKNETKLDLNDTETKHLALMLEIIKRVKQLVIISPTKIPVLFVLIASNELNNIDNVKVIVDGKELTPQDIMRELASVDKSVIEAQWSRLTNLLGETPKQEHIHYTDEELTRTPNGATLRPYQQQIMDFAIKTKRAGLFVDMGLGKTLSTLATLNYLAENDEIDVTKPVLIVAPIMVALDTWSREASKWGYDMDVLINIKLSKKKRELLYDKLLEPQEKLTLLTTNPAQLKSMIEYFQSKHVRPPFEVAIVDELSQFKSPTAQRFGQLTQLTKHAKYFLGLTGTPAPNGLLDIWSQLIAIDGKNGKSFGYDFFQYRNKYFEPDKIGKDGTVYSWRLKHNAEQRIYELMKPTVISMRSEGLIDLPDIIHDYRYVTLPPKARNTYDMMDKKLRYALLDDDNDDDVVLELDSSELLIANTAVLNGKLAQLSSGAMYDNILNISDTTESRKYEIIHDEKMKMLKDIVDNATSPIFVFFYFKSELERMKKFIDYEFIHKDSPNVQDLISRWNRGEVPVMVGHPASVGHGLNLQEGGHTIVWLTTTWSNEQYRQAVKRIYRSGQTHTVSNIHILAENTVDDDIIARINLKEINQDGLMSALDVAHRG